MYTQRIGHTINNLHYVTNYHGLSSTFQATSTSACDLRGLSHSGQRTDPSVSSSVPSGNHPSACGTLFQVISEKIAIGLPDRP